MLAISLRLEYELHLLHTLCPSLSDLFFTTILKYQLYPLFYLFLTTTITSHPKSVPSVSSPLNTRSIFFRSGARNTLFSLVGRDCGLFRVQNSLLENRHYESLTLLTLDSSNIAVLHLPDSRVNFNTLPLRKSAPFCEVPQH